MCALCATRSVGRGFPPARRENRITTGNTTTIRQCHKMSHSGAIILAFEFASKAEDSGCNVLNSWLTPAVTTCHGSHGFRELLVQMAHEQTAPGDGRPEHKPGGSAGRRDLPSTIINDCCSLPKSIQCYRWRLPAEASPLQGISVCHARSHDF